MLRKIKLEHSQRLKIAYDCANAMAFLHNNGVMHRDLVCFFFLFFFLFFFFCFFLFFLLFFFFFFFFLSNSTQKPANLLVVSLSNNSEVNVKLADFGTSRTVQSIYYILNVNEEIDQKRILALPFDLHYTFTQITNTQMDGEHLVTW
jgi:serine/threonine protein kinase